MLVNICKALAFGLLLPWIPQPPKEDKVEGTSVAAPSAAGKSGKGAAPPAKAKVTTVTVSADAGPDVKKAVEVGLCSHC